MRPLPPRIIELLERPNPCIVATVRPDGSPASSAVWYGWEGGLFVTAMGARSPRRRSLEANPHLSATILDGDDWYRQVTIRGRVVDLADDPDHRVIDRFSVHYVGRPYEDHSFVHAVARMEVEHWDQFGLDDLLG